MNNSTEIPKYQSYKEVWAFKIGLMFPEADGSHILNAKGKDDRQIRVSREYMRKHNPQSGGYWVQYEDGYESFSPAKAFEEGYKLMEKTETQKGDEEFNLGGEPMIFEGEILASGKANIRLSCVAHAVSLKTHHQGSEKNMDIIKLSEKLAAFVLGEGVEKLG